MPPIVKPPVTNPPIVKPPVKPEPVKPVDPTLPSVPEEPKPLIQAVGALYYGIRKLPKILPKTGTIPDAGTATRRVVKPSKSLDTELPAWTVSNSMSHAIAPTELSQWLDILPSDADKKANRYIVIPQIGVVVPINTAEKNSADFTNMIDGKEIAINNYLKGGAMQYAGTANTTKEKGNMVVFAHSSYYKSDDGRFKTIFGALPDLHSGQQVWVYEKNSDGVFERFVYKIDASYETLPTDVGVLEPIKGVDQGLTLFTCTPIGTAAKRWVVRAHLIESDTSAKVKSKVDFGSEKLNKKVASVLAKYMRTPESRANLLKLLRAIKEKYANDARRTVIIDKLIEYVSSAV